MHKIRKLASAILPEYSYIPLAAMLLFNCIAYFGTRPFTSGMVHHTMLVSLDNVIPFVPAFISVYLLAYVQWVAGYVLIARENRKLFRWIVIGEIIAKAFAFICFITYPTTLSRPEVADTGLWESLTAQIYSNDAPDNLFPSVHCLESWVCFRGAMYMKKTGRWYRHASFIFTLLVFASTVFVKQHVVMDIVGAVVFVEIGLYLSKKICSFKKRAYLL